MGFVPRTQAPSMENSGYFSFRESRIAALLPSMSTLTESGATKRKLDIPEETEEDEDEDCIIVGEELGQQASTAISDTVNNNGHSASKRRRMDTIVIEWVTPWKVTGHVSDTVEGNYLNDKLPWAAWVGNTEVNVRMLQPGHVSATVAC